MRSHRWTTAVGVFLMGVGSILSAFANSPVDLYLSVGLVCGEENMDNLVLIEFVLRTHPNVIFKF
jgi:hypothetical protein